MEAAEREELRLKVIEYGDRFLTEMSEDETARLDVAFGVAFYMLLQVMQLCPPNHQQDVKDYIQSNLELVYKSWTQ